MSFDVGLSKGQIVDHDRIDITIETNPAAPFPANQYIEVTCTAQSAYTDAFYFQWELFCFQNSTHNEMVFETEFEYGASSTVFWYSSPPGCANLLACLAVEPFGDYYYSFDAIIQDVTGMHTYTLILHNSYIITSLIFRLFTPP